MPKYLREWIFPAILFFVGFFIPMVDDTRLSGPTIYILKFFIGIGLAISGLFFQTLFGYMVVSTIKSRLGFLKGEKKHLSIILMLAAEMVKADGKIDPNELILIAKRLSKEFKGDQVAGYLREFDSYLEIDISIKELGKIIAADFDEAAKAHLMYLLFSLATVDGLLSHSELKIVEQVAKYGQIKSSTYLHIFRTFKYKREQSYRQKSEQKTGRSKSSKNTTALRSAYDLLGVTADATMEKIKKAYRKLAKIHHPDKVSHLGDIHRLKAKEKFQIILDAYDMIKEKRGA
ncbi:MAG: DnaJ domain-containing protein [Crocinitomix sp.]|nr:DnaJ domain-containing protein [Crocinitomix sp.]